MHSLSPKKYYHSLWGQEEKRNQRSIQMQAVSSAKIRRARHRSSMLEAQAHRALNRAEPIVPFRNTRVMRLTRFALALVALAACHDPAAPRPRASNSASILRSADRKNSRSASRSTRPSSAPIRSPPDRLPPSSSQRRQVITSSPSASASRLRKVIRRSRSKRILRSRRSSIFTAPEAWCR